MRGRGQDRRGGGGMKVSLAHAASLRLWKTHFACGRPPERPHLRIRRRDVRGNDTSCTRGACWSLSIWPVWGACEVLETFKGYCEQQSPCERPPAPRPKGEGGEERVPAPIRAFYAAHAPSGSLGRLAKGWQRLALLGECTCTSPAGEGRTRFLAWPCCREGVERAYRRADRRRGGLPGEFLMPPPAWRVAPHCVVHARLRPLQPRPQRCSARI